MQMKTLGEGVPIDSLANRGGEWWLRFEEVYGPLNAYGPARRKADASIVGPNIEEAVAFSK